VNRESDHPNPSRRDRGIVAHLSVQGEDEAAFDRAFWAGVRPEAKIAALWDMVLEARIWRGELGDEPRLQRSVLRIERG
jgi:hypothetical protein